MTDTAMLPPRLLSVRSVARELDCSKSKVYALIEREASSPGTGLPVVRIDGMLRVRREDLEALLVRWGIKSTGSDSTASSGAPSPAVVRTSDAADSALRRGRILGTMHSAKSRRSTAA